MAKGEGKTDAETDAQTETPGFDKNLSFLTYFNKKKSH